jgi:hypothetical protein
MRRSYACIFERSGFVTKVVKMPLASDTPSTVNEVSWVCRAFIRAIPSVFHAFFGHRLSSIATIDPFDVKACGKLQLMLDACAVSRAGVEQMRRSLPRNRIRGRPKGVTA